MRQRKGAREVGERERGWVERKESHAKGLKIESDTHSIFSTRAIKLAGRSVTESVKIPNTQVTISDYTIHSLDGSLLSNEATLPST